MQIQSWCTDRGLTCQDSLHVTLCINNSSEYVACSIKITTKIRHTIGHAHITAITETNEMVPCHLCNLTATQLKIRHLWNSLTVVWFWKGKQGFELKSGNKHDRPSNECQTTCSIICQYVHTRAHYIPQHIHSMILTVNSNVITMNFVSFFTKLFLAMYRFAHICKIWINSLYVLIFSGIILVALWLPLWEFGKMMPSPKPNQNMTKLCSLYSGFFIM